MSSPPPSHGPGQASNESDREAAGEIVRAHDRGTLEYRFSINAASTEALVHERYRDSAAGLEHMSNIGRAMTALSEVCTMTGEVCGEPTAELRQALTTAAVPVYGHLVS